MDDRQKILFDMDGERQWRTEDRAKGRKSEYIED